MTETFDKAKLFCRFWDIKSRNFRTIFQSLLSILILKFWKTLPEFQQIAIFVALKTREVYLFIFIFGFSPLEKKFVFLHFLNEKMSENILLNSSHASEMFQLFLYYTINYSQILKIFGFFCQFKNYSQIRTIFQNLLLNFGKPCQNFNRKQFLSH